MTKAELLAFAQANGIEGVSMAQTKAVMLATIKGAM